MTSSMHYLILKCYKKVPIIVFISIKISDRKIINNERKKKLHLVKLIYFVLYSTFKNLNIVVWV